MGFEVTLFYWVGWLVLTAFLGILAVSLFWILWVLIKGARLSLNIGSIFGFGLWDDTTRENFKFFLRKWHKEQEENEKKEKAKIQ